MRDRRAGAEEDRQAIAALEQLRHRQADQLVGRSGVEKVNLGVLVPPFFKGGQGDFRHS